jgi:hypothetical protein
MTSERSKYVSERICNFVVISQTVNIIRPRLGQKWLDIIEQTWPDLAEVENR